MDAALGGLSRLEILPFDRRRAYVFREEVSAKRFGHNSTVSAFHHMGLIPLGSDRVPHPATFLRHAIHETVHVKSANVIRLGARSGLIKLGFERVPMSVVEEREMTQLFRGFSEGITVLIERAATDIARADKKYRGAFESFERENAANLAAADEDWPGENESITAFVTNADGSVTVTRMYVFEPGMVATIISEIADREDVPILDVFRRMVDAYRSGSFETIKTSIRDRFGPLAWKVLSRWAIGTTDREQTRLMDFFTETDPAERDRIGNEIVDKSSSVKKI